MNSEFDQFNDDSGRNRVRAVEPIHAFRKPVQTVRVDNVRATIWRRQTRAGPMLTATIGREYEDKERSLVKVSSSYAYDELATLIRLAEHVRTLMADLATREGLDAIAGAGSFRTGEGDEGEPSPAAARADDAGDLDVPIVTAIGADARPSDGRARRRNDPQG